MRFDAAEPNSIQINNDGEVAFDMRAASPFHEAVTTGETLPPYVRFRLRTIIGDAGRTLQRSLASSRFQSPIM